MGLCSGKEIEFKDNRTDYEKEFSENLFKMMQQGMAQGATPMPPEMYQALMGAYAVPSTAYGGMNILNNLAGQGPTQFNPLSMFQPQGSPMNYDWQPLRKEGEPTLEQRTISKDDSLEERRMRGGTANPFEYDPRNYMWWNAYNSNEGHPTGGWNQWETGGPW